MSLLFHHHVLFRPRSWPLLALVVMAHVAVAWGLYRAVSAAPFAITPPILVSLIAPEAAPAPKPEPLKSISKLNTIPRQKISLPAASMPQVAPVNTLRAKNAEVNNEAVATPVAATLPQAESATEPMPQSAQVAMEVAEIVKEAVTPPLFNADYLDNPSPAYPRLSRRNGEEGRVMLRVFVEVNGQPSKIQLHKTSGFTLLDQAALDTVQRWKFVPARKGEKPIGAWVVVPIQFNLKG
ncbi:MAG: energy transducer TonB [Methylophilaceae bacterium]